MNVFQGDREKMIKNLQKNLKLVRQASGWDQQQLADLIGVSRQTINNIENQKSPMNATQYVAIAAMLDIRQREKPGLSNVIEAVLMMEDDEQNEGDGQAPNFTIANDTQNSTKSSENNGNVLEGVKAGAAAAGAVAAVAGVVGGPLGMVAGSLLAGWLLNSQNSKKNK